MLTTRSAPLPPDVLPPTTRPDPDAVPPTKAVPLPPWHIARTDSELQLDRELRAAEFRERAMFRRLVAGMRERRTERARRLPCTGSVPNEADASSGGALRASRGDCDHPPPLRSEAASVVFVGPTHRGGEIPARREPDGDRPRSVLLGESSPRGPYEVEDDDDHDDDDDEIFDLEL